MIGFKPFVRRAGSNGSLGDVGRSLVSRGVAAVLALIALLLLLAFVRHAAENLSPAEDEIAHVGAAAWLDATGSNALNLEHPPLTKRLAGAAMRFRGVAPAIDVGRVPPEQWDFGRETLVQDGSLDRDRLEAARMPFALLAIVGAFAVFGWAAAMFGWRAALFALFLYALSPTIHAHGALVLTDLALGTFAIATMALVWGARERGSLALAIAGGAALAAAVTSKFTGLMLVPIVILLLLFEPLTFPSGRRMQALRANLGLGMGVVVCFLFVLLAIASTNGGLGEYVKGISMLGHNHRAEYQYFAMGEFSKTGFGMYFPLTLALKSTPVELGAWALALIACVTAWPLRRASGAVRGAIANAAWLFAFPVAYLLALVLQAPNIGHRYTVPLYPFLFVAAAAVMYLRVAPALRVAMGVLLVLAQGIVAWRSLPDPLAYFNGFAGCRGARAAFCLDDSNIDAGHNLHRIWPSIESRLGPDERPVVLLLGALPHAAFMPRMEPLLASDWEVPRPALYVISGHMVIRWWAAAPRLSETVLFRALGQAESIGNSYFVLDLRGVAAGPAGQPAAP